MHSAHTDRAVHIRYGTYEQWHIQTYMNTAHTDIYEQIGHIAHVLSCVRSKRSENKTSLVMLVSTMGTLSAQRTWKRRQVTMNVVNDTMKVNCLDRIEGWY